MIENLSDVENNHNKTTKLKAMGLEGEVLKLRSQGYSLASISERLKIEYEVDISIMTLSRFLRGQGSEHLEKLSDEIGKHALEEYNETVSELKWIKKLVESLIKKSHEEGDYNLFLRAVSRFESLLKLDFSRLGALGSGLDQAVDSPDTRLVEEMQKMVVQLDEEEKRKKMLEINRDG